MTCSDVHPLAGNYLDGELPEELQERVQRHLLRCSTCRDEVESLRLAVDLLRSTVETPEPDPVFLQNTLDRLARATDCVNRIPPASGQLVLGIGE